MFMLLGVLFCPIECVCSRAFASVCCSNARFECADTRARHTTVESPLNRQSVVSSHNTRTHTRPCHRAPAQTHAHYLARHKPVADRRQPSTAAQWLWRRSPGAPLRALAAASRRRVRFFGVRVRGMEREHLCCVPRPFDTPSPFAGSRRAGVCVTAALAAERASLDLSKVRRLCCEQWPISGGLAQLWLPCHCAQSAHHTNNHNNEQMEPLHDRLLIKPFEEEEVRRFRRRRVAARRRPLSPSLAQNQTTTQPNHHPHNHKPLL